MPGKQKKINDTSLTTHFPDQNLINQHNVHFIYSI